jgi:hypothetical protein
MAYKKVDPKKVVPKQLYDATLKYVNAVRKKAGEPALKALPPALPGIEGCPIGTALAPLHKPYTPFTLPYREGKLVMSGDDDEDDDYDSYWDEDETDSCGVRVTTFGKKTVIRLRNRKTNKFNVLVAPLYVTKFLDRYDLEAQKEIK